jgi:3-keto-disaccharide hydrolase
MRRTFVLVVSVAVLAAALFAVSSMVASPQSVNLPEMKWPIHDRARPQPDVITPGTFSTQDQVGRPPSDAVVLFDGRDLSQWESVKGGPAPWKVGNGYFSTVPKTGDIQTKLPIGDCQLHVEWATPDPPHGTDQDRGNSGVFIMGLYEVQVLDSYQSQTYADGQAGAIYGQYPPLVNACRPPGHWQSYDIIWHGPRFDASGKLLRLATITVIQNGVLVQDHVSLTGPTEHQHRPPYHATPEKLPLRLQDHNHPVRFRNIWVRELHEAGD